MRRIKIRNGWLTIHDTADLAQILLDADQLLQDNPRPTARKAISKETEKLPVNSQNSLLTST